MRSLQLLALLHLGVLVAVGGVDWIRSEPAPQPTSAGGGGGAIIADTGNQWFRQIKQYCNPVEAAVMIRRTPPPQDDEGPGYAAACFALAGKIDQADAQIRALPNDADRERAARIVFKVGHPIADAGDDDAAGPIMRLVVKYRPNSYMALYHAGMAEFNMGDTRLAKLHLERFLELYDRNDGWRKNGLTVLAKIAKSDRAPVSSEHGQIQ